MSSQNNSLGYMIVDGAEGQIRGASLVTDARGIPMDFRYTDPIKPSRLERILYGSALDTYLKEELILESLLDAVEIDPQLWICNDSEMLIPLKTVGKVKAVLIEESPHVPLDAVGHIESTADSKVFWIQTEPNGNPLRAEFPEGTRTDEIQQIAGILTDAAKTMNLLEPFTRIQKALSSLGSGGE